MKKYILLSLVLILALFSGPIFAGNTGNIKGRVIDAKTKKPLVKARVILVELASKAETDENGDFFMTGIPMGFYSIAISYVGYEDYLKTGIAVGTDSTYPFGTAKMKKKGISGGTIKVTATRKLIKREVGVSETEISEDELKDAPVPDFFRMAQTVPGVVGSGGQLHIRGGRSDEVNYMVDGMTIRDPVTGTFGGTLNTNSIKSISIKTGGFSAEYGGALSGIINVVTKEGGRKMSGSFSYYTGKMIWDTADQGDKDMQWELGGPISIFGKDKKFPFLSFYTSGSRFISDLKWLSDPYHNTKINLDKFLDGYYGSDDKQDYLHWPWEDFIDTSSKLTLQISPKLKVKLGFQYSRAYINIMAPSAYATENVDNQPTQFQNNVQYNLEWDHTISSSLFYQIFIYRFMNNIKLSVHDKEPWEYDWSYEPEDRDYPVYEDRTSVQYSIKTDVVNQLNTVHQIKTGFSYSLFDISENYRSYPGEADSYRDEFHRYMDEQAFYLLDLMDWDQDLVMNLGLRYDRRQYAKSQFSPRMFMTFAINPRTKFRFNYGIFYQPPAAMYVLQEKYDQVQDQSNNQYLDAENSVNFEYGIDYLLSDLLKMSISAYYKNTSDLVKFVAGNSRLNGNDRDMPMNADHSYSQGLEFQFTKAFGNNYSWRLAYTLSDAKGTSSNPYISISVLPPKEFPLDWDITHNLVFQFQYNNGDLGVNAIGYWHTGEPYTSVDGNKKGLVNDARFPIYKRIDATLFKYLPMKWFGLKYRLYFEITNLFNTRNITALYADGTARAYSTPSRAKAGIDLTF
ncbi:TonB-dependent receptor [bacterium]|nr:TonB-dependent receptor [bacterium]